MPQPHALILRAPGTNCDQETAFAFETAGAKATPVHIRAVLDNPRQLEQFQILCIPGGFSYGDDLGAGRILATQMCVHLADRLQEFRQQGKLILGICNGFQVLIKTGLLFEDDPRGEPLATLTNNDCGHFEDRWVTLRHAGGNCVIFRGIETLELPVAHAEGKFVASDVQTLQRLDAAGHLVLRYADSAGNYAGGRFPENPNGAQADVAGACDSTGRVCGLMPHPERFIDPTQHPRWTRHPGPLPAAGAGLQIFQKAVGYFK